MDKRPILMIATPMYGGLCYGDYVASLLNAKASLETLYGLRITWAHLTNESLITRGRNRLADLFLASNADKLLFIDSDISFTTEDIMSLWDSDYDVACGLYPKKEINWGAIERAAASGKTQELSAYAGAFVVNFDTSKALTLDEKGFLEVRHAGTGFMMIKRGVFELLRPYVNSYRASDYKFTDTGEYVDPEVSEFFATSVNEAGVFLSEDYHFCDLWRKHGGKVHVNPLINLTHLGTHRFYGNVLKAGFDQGVEA
jgi:hypothetical protein